LECTLQPKIAKSENPYFVSSGSFKVIDVADTTKILITSACCDGSMPMPICDRFDETLANNGKIMTFTGVLLFDALVRRFP